MLLLVMPMRAVLRRLPQVIVGLVLYGVGVAFMAAGNVGFGAWNVFHEGISELTGLSLGEVIILVGVVVVALFIPLNEKAGIGTLLNVALIGTSVDITLSVLNEPGPMWVRIAYMIGGTAMVGFASGLYIGGGLGPGPRDGVMTGLAKRGIQIWKARTGLEVTVLIIGLFLGGTAGLGTIWFTFTIGPQVHFWLDRFRLPAVTSGPVASTRA